MRHNRLGQLCRGGMRHLKEVVDDIEAMKIKDTVCEICIQGKHIRLPFPKNKEHSTKYRSSCLPTSN